MSNHKLQSGQFLKITELYAFIATDKNGHEGIMAFQNSSGGWMPMIGADTERVDSLFPIADRMAKKFNATYELRYFTSCGTVAPSLYKKKEQE